MDAIQKLQLKRGSLRKRIANLEKHQGEVSRMEKLYVWRGNQVRARRGFMSSNPNHPKEQSPKHRLQRYKNYLQTVEEHLDKVKGSVYQKAKVTKEYAPKGKGSLKLKKGQIVFIHVASDAGRLKINMLF